MNEEKDQKPGGHEQDFSELAKHSRSPPGKTGGGIGRALLRGFGITVGIVAVIFFIIVGTCFLG